MKKIGLTIIIVLILSAVAFLLYSPKDSLPSSVQAPTQSSQGIQFPTSGSVLTQGQTYSLKWTPGTGSTQIFLIDTALESQGESVSIADRIYNIPNLGKYTYTVPSHIPDGTYKLEIGNYTSQSFQITDQ